MHTIKLQVEDNIYEHIMFFLNNLNRKDLKIIENKSTPKILDEDLTLFSNHTANLIDDWKDDSEDDIWK
ncbi:hypothetical protein MNB_SV-15-1330 [hydrothermal vent metagenome]|uniref:Uncharacterized protein n=1 Tax=hydrothermal vent metagenome TaxID=652676 RepID=A0A1W1EI38_9ZZZZ